MIDRTLDAIRARQKRALAKAFAWGLQSEVRPVATDRYQVPSRTEPGLLYTVARTRRNGQEWFACSCPAGVAGLPCAHAAAVYLHRLEQRTGGTVTAVRPV
jgi:hypothetical protein